MLIQVLVINEVLFSVIFNVTEYYVKELVHEIGYNFYWHILTVETFNSVNYCIILIIYYVIYVLYFTSRFINYSTLYININNII